MKTKRFISIILTAIMMLGVLIPLGAVSVSAEPAALNPGNIVTFGAYPQSLVTDAALIARLNALGTEEDAELDGWKYALQKGDWFRFEPIEWRVLQKRQNTISRKNEVLLLADKVLDAYAFGALVTGDYVETPLAADWLFDKANPCAFGIGSYAEFIPPSIVANNYGDFTVGEYPAGEWVTNVFRPASMSQGISFMSLRATVAWTPGMGVLSLGGQANAGTLQNFANSRFAAFGLGTNPSRTAKPTDYAVAADVYTDGTNARWWIEHESDDYQGRPVGRWSALGLSFTPSYNRGAAVDFDGSLNGFQADFYDYQMGMRPTLQLNPEVFDNMPSVTYHDGMAADKQDVRFGEPVFAGADVPTRAGYEFLGWAEAQDAEEPDYQPGELISPLIYGYEYIRDGIWDFPQDLYAVWKPVKYTYSFHYGSGEEAKTYPKVTDVDFPLDLVQEWTPVPTRPGFRFLGWALTENASGPDYQITDSITGINQDQDFYAVWMFHVDMLSDGNVSVAPVNAFPSGTAMTVSPIGLNTTVGVNGNNPIWLSYNISFRNGGAKVQPDEAVTVRIFIPQEFIDALLANGGNLNQIDVKHKNSVTGLYENITEKGAEGPDAEGNYYMVFQAEAFSEYRLEWQPAKEADKTGTQKYIRLWGKTTKYAANFWNWLLCIFCFGWIWMMF